MNFIFRLFLITVFIVAIVLTIAYARGYRWDLGEKKLSSTGILSINSSPGAAKIFVNGVLKGATNSNLILPPGDYQVEVKKDGWTSWTKSLKLQGELVYTINAQLFPLNPSLSPLTNLGIVKTIPVDETERIIIFSDNGDPLKDGIYLFEATKRPLSLLPPLKLMILKSNLPVLEPNFDTTTVYFSPDYKEAIFDLNPGRLDNQAFLLSLETENQSPFEVTTSKNTLLDAWNEERTREVLKILETFPKEIVKVASDSVNIISFSPDKTKFLYQTKTDLELPLVIKPLLIAANQTEEQRDLKKDEFYVYDKKEDKNYQITNFQFPISKQVSINQLPITNSIQWYSDSRHLVFLDGNKVSIVDYDNTNKQTVYSGPFEKPFFITTTDGNIIVSANLNPENNLFPDLYLVGIR